MTPAVVGVGAGRSGFKPSSRSARAGLGRRVILRTGASASRKPARSCGSCRSMQARMRRRPSPVVRIRSSQEPPAKARANARTGAGSGASRMATSGQRTTLAPRRSSIAANTSSSRVSGTAMVRPASGCGSIPRHLSRAALAGYTWVTLHWSYSDGERAGYVQKLSRKGWLCKTWEGEMAMVTMPGTVAEKFAFTVREPAVAAKLNANVGKRMALHYEQHKWIPTSCFGDSEYFVTDVRVTE